MSPSRRDSLHALTFRYLIIYDYNMFDFQFALLQNPFATAYTLTLSKDLIE